MVILNKCRRSDNKHFDLCQNSDNVKPSDYNNELCDLNISWTNKKRIEINETLMNNGNA